MSFEGNSQKDYENIIKTNDQAAECRLSAIKAGLVSINQLVEIENLEKLIKFPKRKQPLINRGTFIRTSWIDERIIELENSIDLVLVLGAGFDMRALRFPHLKFYEMDLPEVIHKKQKAIPCYSASLIACDLRGASKQDFEFIKEKRILVISECVFSYIEKQNLKDISNRLFELASHIELIIFEPITDPEHHFICILMHNMDIKLPGLFASKSGLIDFYSGQFALKLSCLLKDAELQEENRKILEGYGKLDEYEEWNLIGSHYGFFHFSSREK
jgi:O-methyltransferase involved in polyketide biosynthesis